MKRILIGATIWACLLFIVLITQAAAAHGGSPGTAAPHSSEGPEIVYITNFEMDTSNLQEGGRFGRRLQRIQQDPEEKAQNLVELLAATVTKELQDRGIPARRLYPDQDVPLKGWLVKGEFLEVDEGNRLRRAAIGFGVGSTEMLAEMSIFDLSRNRNEPFLVCGTGSRSGRGPGAIVMMNPYAAAAKFVMSKRAPERDVAKTARQIAGVIAKSFEDARTH